MQIQKLHLDNIILRDSFFHYRKELSDVKINRCESFVEPGCHRTR
jgi:hypothetical protein